MLITNHFFSIFNVQTLKEETLDKKSLYDVVRIGFFPNHDQKQLLLNFVSPLTKIKNLFITNAYQIKDKNEINKYYKSAKEIKKIFDQLPIQLQEDVM